MFARKRAGTLENVAGLGLEQPDGDAARDCRTSDHLLDEGGVTLDAGGSGPIT